MNTPTQLPHTGASSIVTLDAWVEGFVLTHVLRGNIVHFTATGQWTTFFVSQGDMNPWAGPDGYGQHEPAAGYVMPSANEAALLGRIGNGEWFVIGSSLQRTCEADGDLVVQMNDLRGAYHDNAGSMQVTYSIEPGQV